MTVTVLLVRHAAHDDVGGYLAGRKAGVVLGPEGLAQAARLAGRMRLEPPSEIWASPRERTVETAEAIAAGTGAGPIRTAEELDEIDFGAWSGRRFDDLDVDPEWRRWNAVRSLARTPAGETMLDVQHRAVGFLQRVSDGADGRRLALVSHADVIKAVVLWVVGAPLDAWPRLEIAPASVTTLSIGAWGAQLTGLNEVTA